MKSTCQCGRPSRLTIEQITRVRRSKEHARPCVHCAALEAGGYDQYSAPVGRTERKHTGTSFATINARCDAWLLGRGLGGEPFNF